MDDGHFESLLFLHDLFLPRISRLDDLGDFLGGGEDWVGDAGDDVLLLRCAGGHSQGFFFMVGPPWGGGRGRVDGSA